MFEDLTQQGNIAAASAKGGYFTVHIETEAGKMPYVVFAPSDFAAARMVKRETGYMAAEHDVEGPFIR